jgi:hypothetical protein
VPFYVRLTEQISIALAEIAALKAASDRQGADASLRRWFRNTIGLDISQIQQMSPEALSELLETASGLRQSRGIMLAELLLQDGELHSEDSVRQSLDRLHAFCLIGAVVDSLQADDQRVYRAKLEDLRRQLESLEGNSYVAGKLAQYAATRKV